MSGGVGSIYIKVLPASTVIYNPERTEKRIREELWVAKYYDASAHEWKVDNLSRNEYAYLDPSITAFNSEAGLDGYIEKCGPYYPLQIAEIT
ncbi:MAG: hypothetical protein QXK47_04720 [Candidatus Bathyarchaeia archaeon]